MGIPHNAPDGNGFFKKSLEIRAAEKAAKGELCCGTIDSWLVYKLTGGREFRTDYSNASRTQMFNIKELAWDKEVCGLFKIPVSCLAEVTDSNGFYGETASLSQ